MQRCMQISFERIELSTRAEKIYEKNDRAVERPLWGGGKLKSLLNGFEEVIENQARAATFRGHYSQWRIEIQALWRKEFHQTLLHPASGKVVGKKTDVASSQDQKSDAFAVRGGRRTLQQLMKPDRLGSHSVTWDNRIDMPQIIICHLVRTTK